VNTWKVILATLVIFAAGFFTGGTLLHKFGAGVRVTPAEASGDPPFLPWEVKEEYVRRMTRELELTGQQKETISQVVLESQQRIKILFELVGPEMREEMKQVRDSISAVLTPEQRVKFEELRKRRHSRSKDDGKSRRDSSRSEGRNSEKTDANLK
jgi:Spy/CpxP family protein refolding chaperone